ncbi:DNA alkylation repair protein [Photobacterium kishitanii]|uniref:DNA alkylation repair protein n=1 Tax=Photobacterium kishitanii TaxID=318456 RepID=A0A2T3KKR7_9GAMM|nr:DNA alkylation repair protein [Photobacterium kishitanii]OBU27914.1 DNA alkylation repair protein [Photobacterium kishitanii]PSU91673.1 DNA alkylation repair protein [Photobacterium kishitanii]PSU92908.1 DNA alkylation repair protein [Photobacterium kishitanii]PSV00111.1 DNA alkylation repair protein [Photobacterium kishitanii]PSV23179.1 DNA alkylation repair protein [Photobacterium kishitanii]
MSLVIPMVILMQQHLAAEGSTLVAKKMQYDLNTQQPFYGVSSEKRHKIFQLAIAHTHIDTIENYHRLLLWLWSGVYREERYLALDAGEYYSEYQTLASFDIYLEMLETADNVDTLDRLATNLIGKVILQERDLESYLIQWRESDSVWLKRASVLVHLQHKQQTNEALLSETILYLAADKSMLVQQAMGQVLNAYSQINFAFVDSFIKNNMTLLTPLCRREARKLTMMVNSTVD